MKKANSRSFLLPVGRTDTRGENFGRRRKEDWVVALVDGQMLKRPVAVFPFLQSGISYCDSLRPCQRKGQTVAFFFCMKGLCLYSSTCPISPTHIFLLLPALCPANEKDTLHVRFIFFGTQAGLPFSPFHAFKT